jgi:hypothetical protein
MVHKVIISHIATCRKETVNLVFRNLSWQAMYIGFLHFGKRILTAFVILYSLSRQVAD